MNVGRSFDSHGRPVGGAKGWTAIRRLPAGPLPIRVLALPPSTGEPLPAQHTHDHLALGYFDQAGGSLRSGDDEWQLAAGDVVLVAPGEVYDARSLADARGWIVFFEPGAVGTETPSTMLLWEGHPLLFPFAAGTAGEPRRFSVTPDERGTWTAALVSLEREVRERAEGFELIAGSLLTILLVALARLASDAPRSFRWNREPLLADVFAFIEERFRGPISLGEVAAAVNLSPGYLTTVIRHRTGRPVQAWITERRMAEARRLLRHDQRYTVEEVGRRVGYDDAGYFTRSFRKIHGMSPAAWRRGGASPIPQRKDSR